MTSITRSFPHVDYIANSASAGLKAVAPDMHLSATTLMDAVSQKYNELRFSISKQEISAALWKETALLRSFISQQVAEPLLGKPLMPLIEKGAQAFVQKLLPQSISFSENSMPYTAQMLGRGVDYFYGVFSSVPSRDNASEEFGLPELQNKKPDQDAVESIPATVVAKSVLELESRPSDLGKVPAAISLRMNFGNLQSSPDPVLSDASSVLHSSPSRLGLLKIADSNHLSGAAEVMAGSVFVNPQLALPVLTVANHRQVMSSQNQLALSAVRFSMSDQDGLKVGMVPAAANAASAVVLQVNSYDNGKDLSQNNFLSPVQSERETASLSEAAVYFLFGMTNELVAIAKSSLPAEEDENTVQFSHHAGLSFQTTMGGAQIFHQIKIDENQAGRWFGAGHLMVTAAHQYAPTPLVSGRFGLMLPDQVSAAVLHCGLMFFASSNRDRLSRDDREHQIFSGHGFRSLFTVSANSGSQSGSRNPRQQIFPDFSNANEDEKRPVRKHRASTPVALDDDRYVPLARDVMV